LRKLRVVLLNDRTSGSLHSLCADSTHFSPLISMERLQLVK
jgi:hypothetical protein